MVPFFGRTRLAALRFYIALNTMSLRALQIYYYPGHWIQEHSVTLHLLHCCMITQLKKQLTVVMLGRL